MQQMTWGTLLPPFPENPDSLRAAHASAVYACYLPDGGQRFGGLRVASVELPSDTSLSDVVMATLKLDYCVDEEMSYQEWSSDEARNFLKLLSPGPGTRWTEPITQWSVDVDADHFQWLLTGAKDTVHAQQTLPNPLNDRVAFPDARAVDEHEIDALRFLSRDFLRAVLNDEWDDMIALFECNGRWYLVKWWLTA